jgi:putative endonuclease
MSRTYQFFVYILANDSGTLYVGVTDDLQKRVWEHKNKVHEGFTSQREIHRLLYWEEFIDVRNAIAREKQLKAWTRKKKIALFEKKNPVWLVLSRDW